MRSKRSFLICIMKYLREEMILWMCNHSLLVFVSDLRYSCQQTVLYRSTFKPLKNWKYWLHKSVMFQRWPLFKPTLMSKTMRREKSVPHTQLWTNRSSVHPVLSFSTITPALSLTHSLTHTAAHFLGHLFLRLFQLMEEFASQMVEFPQQSPERLTQPESLKRVMYTHLLTFNHIHTSNTTLNMTCNNKTRRFLFYSSSLDIPDSPSSQNWESFVCRRLSLAHLMLLPPLIIVSVPLFVNNANTSMLSQLDSTLHLNPAPPNPNPQHLPWRSLHRGLDRRGCNRRHDPEMPS